MNYEKDETCIEMSSLIPSANTISLFSHVLPKFLVPQKRTALQYMPQDPSLEESSLLNSLPVLIVDGEFMH
jgi:hypothetical protein